MTNHGDGSGLEPPAVWKPSTERREQHASTICCQAPRKPLTPALPAQIISTAQVALGAPGWSRTGALRADTKAAPTL